MNERKFVCLEEGDTFATLRDNKGRGGCDATGIGRVEAIDPEKMVVSAMWTGCGEEGGRNIEMKATGSFRAFWLFGPQLASVLRKQSEGEIVLFNKNQCHKSGRRHVFFVNGNRG